MNEEGDAMKKFIKRNAKKVLLSIIKYTFAFVQSRPWLMRIAKKLLFCFPTLSSRIKKIVYPSVQERPQNITDPAMLTPQAREIYDILIAMRDEREKKCE